MFIPLFFKRSPNTCLPAIKPTVWNQRCVGKNWGFAIPFGLSLSRETSFAGLFWVESLHFRTDPYLVEYGENTWKYIITNHEPISIFEPHRGKRRFKNLKNNWDYTSVGHYKKTWKTGLQVCQQAVFASFLVCGNKKISPNRNPPNTRDQPKTMAVPTVLERYQRMPRPLENGS